MSGDGGRASAPDGLRDALHGEVIERTTDYLYADEIVDALLPVIAAHVAAETETLRAEVVSARAAFRIGHEALERAIEEHAAQAARADDAEWRLALMRADRDTQAARADDAERRIAAVEAVCAEMENLAEHGAFIHNDPYECTVRLRAALDPEADR